MRVVAAALLLLVTAPAAASTGAAVAQADRQATRIAAWRAAQADQAAEAARLDGAARAALAALDRRPAAAGDDVAERARPAFALMRAYYAADARAALLGDWLRFAAARPSPALQRMWFESQLLTLASFDAENAAPLAAAERAGGSAALTEALERALMVAGTRDGVVAQLSALVAEQQAADAPAWRGLGAQLADARRR